MINKKTKPKTISIRFKSKIALNDLSVKLQKLKKELVKSNVEKVIIDIISPINELDKSNSLMIRIKKETEGTLMFSKKEEVKRINEDDEPDENMDENDIIDNLDEIDSQKKKDEKENTIRKLIILRQEFFVPLNTAEKGSNEEKETGLKIDKKTDSPITSGDIPIEEIERIIEYEFSKIGPVIDLEDEASIFAKPNDAKKMLEGDFDGGENDDEKDNLSYSDAFFTEAFLKRTFAKIKASNSDGAKTRSEIEKEKSIDKKNRLKTKLFGKDFHFRSTELEKNENRPFSIEFDDSEQHKAKRILDEKLKALDSQTQTRIELQINQIKKL